MQYRLAVPSSQEAVPDPQPQSPRSEPQTQVDADQGRRRRSSSRARPQRPPATPVFQRQRHDEGPSSSQMPHFQGYSAGPSSQLTHEGSTGAGFAYQPGSSYVTPEPSQFIGFQHPGSESIFDHFPSTGSQSAYDPRPLSVVPFDLSGFSDPQQFGTDFMAQLFGYQPYAYTQGYPVKGITQVKQQHETQTVPVNQSLATNREERVRFATVCATGSHVLGPGQRPRHRRGHRRNQGSKGNSSPE